MNARVFLDTNVLLYAISNDPRREASEDILRQGGFISVQVLNEFASVARRKMKLSCPEISQALQDVRSLCEPPLPVTVQMHEAALMLAAKHKLSIYDALIVAAALEADCVTLYSEDLQHGQAVADRLVICNPFLPAR